MKNKIEKLIGWLNTSGLYIYIVTNKKTLISYILMMLLFIVFKIICLFDWPVFFSVFIPACVSLCVTLVDSKEYSSNIKIMSLCYEFMHKKEGVSIDDILGILISNKYRNKMRQSATNFFDILDEKCNIGNVEDRRRIAEALPMLYKINRPRTKQLIENLRDDYDETYHDDNRRRVIESFRYYNKYTNFDYYFVKDMLKIREGDSIYTILAIIEIIIFTNIINRKSKENELIRIRNDIFQNANFSDDQREFINEAIQFLNEVNDINKRDSIDIIFNKYTDKFNQSKFYMRILIAKNMINICPYHEQCKKKNKCLNKNNKKSILNFFDLCFISEKKVRRPMAKEDVCFCLLRMMSFPEFENEAKEKIVKLIKDDDSIIATTAFDYIYDIYDKDARLFKEIISYCIKLPKDNILRIRAKHILDMVNI